MRMATDDEDLALAAAAGDAAAFSCLVERNYDHVFRLCFRLTGHKEQAEDLTQDIFCALPEKLRSFRKKAAFRTWLYRITVNASHDQRRLRASYGRATEGWGSWELARRAETAETASQLAWLHDTLPTLPQDLRETLALTLGEEMTQAQTAAVLSVSEGTIAWRLSDIKRRLRAVREEEERV